MIQQKLKLSSEFKQILSNCDEIWVAVALMNEGGFKYIQENINPKAKQNFLVGIGLPTSPGVLSALKERENGGIFQSKVYHKAGDFFHPKAYIIKSSNKLSAFIGSSNCTDGGFDKNIELNVKTDDLEFCNNVLKWFNTLFKFGIKITDELIQSYSFLYERRTLRMKEDLKELGLVVSNSDPETNLDDIDFTNQFFKKAHYEAFLGTKPWSTADKINEERINVRNKLFKLNDKLYPKIIEQNWDLHEHYVFDDTVSSAVHGIFTGSELSGIWLHYGRDKKDIKLFGEKQTPLDFMRLQIIIHKDSIGIWNRVGKDYGSSVDRGYFKNKIYNDSVYRESFFSIIKRLPNTFYIRLNEQKVYVDSFKTEKDLSDFILKDELKYYFIIGVELLPDDIRLSEKEITNTIIENFTLLYPTYELMKHKLNF